MSFPTITYIPGSETTHGTTVVGTKTTGSISVAANSLLVVAGVMAGAGGAISLHATTPFTTTIPGAGAWTIHVEQQANTVNNNLIFIASCPISTGGSGTVTVNLASANAGRWAFGCFQVDTGYRTSTPIVQAKASVTTGGAVPQSISDTLTSAPLAGSLIFAVAGCNFQSGETVLDIAPGAWADGELRETNSGGAISISYSAAYDAGGSQAVSFDNLENNNNFIGAIEIAEARAIAVTSPVDYQGRQRNRTTNLADIPIAGTYTGSPTAIEADFNGGGYEIIDASPSGGTFSGTLLAQAAGQGTLRVRFTNDTGVSDTLANVLITDVIALIGQSNIGYAQNNDTPSGAGAPMMYNITAADSSPYTAGAIVALADPINNETGEAHGSPWPHFAELYYADYGYPPAFVVGYKGGTGLVGATSHWDKDGDGTYYDRMVARLSALATLGLNDILCFFWDQGGADVLDGTTKAAYKSAQSAMLDNFQADMSFFDSPSSVKMLAVAFENWCTATTGDNTGIPSDDDIDAIRLAHIESWTEDGDILPGPTGHDQKFGTGAGPGGVHWYTDAERERLAKRWYRCFKAHYNNGTEPARGPQVSTIEIASAVVTVTFAGGVSPLQNGTTIQGWEVKDDGTPVTIDSVAINGSNSMAIDITLNSTPSGVVTVSWAHGNDAAANPLVDSGTIAEFPPEPFVDRGLTVAATGRKRRGVPGNRLGPWRW